MALSLDRTCKILLEECAHVRRNEEVLILADHLQAPELVTALSQAAHKSHAKPISMVYPTISPYREPPRSVTQAMKNVDVVIACARTPIASGVLEESLKAGTRVLSMFRITIDALRRTVPIDYRSLAKEMKRIKKILDASHFVEVSTSRGTHLCVQMANKPTKVICDLVRDPSRCP